MNAKDFRIGNLVKVDSQEREVNLIILQRIFDGDEKVEPIEFDPLHRFDDERVSLPNKNELSFIIMWRLFKFEKRGDEWFLFLEGFNPIAKFKYVHEFQNIMYAITGIESHKPNKNQ